VRFPASFVEWYSIKGALDVLSELHEEDSLDSPWWSEDVVKKGILYLPGCQSPAGSVFIYTDGGDDRSIYHLILYWYSCDTS
jgi:hypothetical protein